MFPQIVSYDPSSRVRECVNHLPLHKKGSRSLTLLLEELLNSGNDVSWFWKGQRLFFPLKPGPTSGVFEFLLMTLGTTTILRVQRFSSRGAGRAQKRAFPSSCHADRELDHHEMAFAHTCSTVLTHSTCGAKKTCCFHQTEVAIHCLFSFLVLMQSYSFFFQTPPLFVVWTWVAQYLPKLSFENRLLLGVFLSV